MSKVLICEPIETTIERASTALRVLKTEVALYFSEGRLRASQKESKHHHKRLLMNANGLVGVYQKGCDFYQICGDIEEFYK